MSDKPKTCNTTDRLMEKKIVYEELTKRIEGSEETIAKLREALEWYADDFNQINPSKARAALKECFGDK